MKSTEIEECIKITVMTLLTVKSPVDCLIHPHENMPLGGSKCVSTHVLLCFKPSQIYVNIQCTTLQCSLGCMCLTLTNCSAWYS